MSWTDGLIIPGFELCTNLSMQSIKEMEEQLKIDQVNPRDLKMKLAKEIITIFHGQIKADEAEENWLNTFSKKEIPENIESINAGKNDLLIDLFLANEIVSSKTEFRRLVENGAITNLTSNQKLVSPNEKVQDGVYRIGKKRFCKIEIQ